MAKKNDKVVDIKLFFCKQHVPSQKYSKSVSGKLKVLGSYRSGHLTPQYRDNKSRSGGKLIFVRKSFPFYEFKYPNYIL